MDVRRLVRELAWGWDIGQDRESRPFSDPALVGFHYLHLDARQSEIICQRCGWKHRTKKCLVRDLAAGVVGPGQLKGLLIDHQRSHGRTQE
jgi:hypothetical protein